MSVLAIGRPTQTPAVALQSYRGGACEQQLCRLRLSTPASARVSTCSLSHHRAADLQSYRGGAWAPQLCRRRRRYMCARAGAYNCACYALHVRACDVCTCTRANDAAPASAAVLFRSSRGKLHRESCCYRCAGARAYASALVLLLRLCCSALFAASYTERLAATCASAPARMLAPVIVCTRVCAYVCACTRAGGAAPAPVTAAASALAFVRACVRACVCACTRACAAAPASAAANASASCGPTL